MTTTETTTNEQLYIEGRYDELFERNTDFIWFLRKRYKNIYIEEEEFFSLCCLAFTRALKGFNPDVSLFVSFWGTVINREMLNYLKVYKRKESYELEFMSLDAPLEDSDLSFHDILTDSNNSIDAFLDSMDSEIIKDCIKKLTRKQIAVYELYLQGYTHKSIAEKLNVTRQAVGASIKNGKETLRIELRKAGISI